MLLAELLEHLDAAHARHHHVEQNGVVGSGGTGLEHGRAAVGDVDLVALTSQAPRQDLPVVLVIVDDEDATERVRLLRLLLAHASFGSCLPFFSRRASIVATSRSMSTGLVS